MAFGGALGAGGHFGLEAGPALDGGRLGFRHQGLEQPGVVAVLGIPLHAQAEPVSLQLDRLHHLVMSPRHGEKPVADPVDRLVMRGGHLPGIAEHAPELARGADRHRREWSS